MSIVFNNRIAAASNLALQITNTVQRCDDLRDAACVSGESILLLGLPAGTRSIADTPYR